MELSEFVRRVLEVCYGIPLRVRVESYLRHLVLQLFAPKSHSEYLLHLLFLLAVNDFATRL